MSKKTTQPKVIVAMSGGVDSSVVAAILKNQRYDVEGVYIQVWSAEDYLTDCPWQKEMEDARRVCEKLQIPFRTIHLEKEYRQKVVEYMIDGYRRAATPNPDIMCNREIKFGVFFNWAVAQGVDYVATGHYARKFKVQSSKLKVAMKSSKFLNLLQKHENTKTQNHENIKTLKQYNNEAMKQFNNKSGKDCKYKLLKGVDPAKDQSYFLYTLTQEKLARILFPIGDYQKSEVRQMAKKFRLHNWNKKDSQGICFIGKVELKNFLKKYIKPKKGPILTTEGKQIGEHDGIFYYTIGQRRGFGFAGGAFPYYVADRRIKDNTLIVASGRDHPTLYSQELLVYNVNWIGQTEPPLPFTCKAKIRYGQNDQECEIAELGNCDIKRLRYCDIKILGYYLVKFKKPQFAAAPGQSIVFYQNDECLGGGVIREKLKVEWLYC